MHAAIAKTDNEQESSFSNYIVYVDESGDHSLQSIDHKYPIFVLAFCVFHKRHYSEAIVPALEKFKFNHFGHDQIVLHENEIRKEKGAFNIFRSREEQQAFMNELGEIIEVSNFILISCTIDKRLLKKPSDIDSNPYHTALGFCMETLYEFLKEKNQHKNRTHIVVECRGDKEDKELELEFRRICDGNNNRLGLSLPLEVIFSDKKVMSSGLQLADLVARPIGLHTLKPEQENRAFDVLKEKFYCAGGRDNVGEDYEGVGMKIYPAPESEKPR
ncbi:MAG: 3-deoxy-D-manno-octulosonic acid transferase [Neptuniibacter caesariensis]|uniref:3-deoxy-D-manno-octulosonic acid transferase n=1 Tax=Neptuniibacter caesariensis TaxID=207954 RepID=A0A2G6JB76_NEPCE|nr:MAG: 3-deoxy-D-manno-octulosonic acid transferase [Neptuniibacter caesariensis]